MPFKGDLMDIKFRDVSSGIVEARAVIEIAPGMFINEVTILSKDGVIEVELPSKSFKGKDGKVHYLDILSFENEDKKTIWLLDVKQAYLKWRGENKKVLIYER